MALLLAPFVIYAAAIEPEIPIQTQILNELKEINKNTKKGYKQPKKHKNAYKDSG